MFLFLPFFFILSSARLLTSSEISVVLAEHNKERACWGVAPLAYDEEAASFAAAHASRCIFQHSSSSPFGENLFAATGSNVDFVRAIASLNSERSNWDCASNDCRGVCGHFTQNIWEATTAVGCAVQVCTSNNPFPTRGTWHLLTCAYSPPGNFVGRRPVPVSKCPLRAGCAGAATLGNGGDVVPSNQPIPPPVPQPQPQPTPPSLADCTSQCHRPFIGDNICDPVCNVAACSFDGGDCPNTNGNTPTASPPVVAPPPPTSPGSDYYDYDEYCPHDCPDSWLGDGYCDDVCNVGGCHYDFGDCDGSRYVAPSSDAGDTACTYDGKCGTCSTDCPATSQFFTVSGAGVLGCDAAGASCCVAKASCSVPSRGACGSCMAASEASSCAGDTFTATEGGVGCASSSVCCVDAQASSFEVVRLIEDLSMVGPLDPASEYAYLQSVGWTSTGGVYSARDAVDGGQGSSDSTVLIVSIVAVALVVSCCFFAAGVAGCIVLQRTRGNRGLVTGAVQRARRASRRNSVAGTRASFNR